MSVTSKKGEEDPLTLYVDFLNVDLSADPRPKLKKGQKLKDFLNQFERDTLPCKFKLSTGEPIPDLHPRNWLEEAKGLQEEMRNDLFPIAARKDIPEKLFPLFERWACLTEKLNEMNFTRRWDPHPPKNKKDRIIIRGWNFKPDYNQRDIWYLGLAERLEGGDLERLRLCSICGKYFSARDIRQRFCVFKCSDEYDNKDAKIRVKRHRAKQKVIKIKVEKKGKTEQQVRCFSEFMSLARSHPQDIWRVGPVVLKLGQGDGKKGWNLIKQWESKLKNGESPHQVFNDLPKENKDYFSK